MAMKARGAMKENGRVGFFKMNINRIETFYSG